MVKGLTGNCSTLRAENPSYLEQVTVAHLFYLQLHCTEETQRDRKTYRQLLPVPSRAVLTVHRTLLAYVLNIDIFLLRTMCHCHLLPSNLSNL